MLFLFAGSIRIPSDLFLVPRAGVGVEDVEGREEAHVFAEVGDGF